MNRTELRDALTGLYNHTDDPRLIGEIRKLVERVTAHATPLVSADAVTAAFREIITICTESAGDCRRRMGTRLGNCIATAEAALGSLPPAAADYVVWSNEHRAWWGPNRAGYCTTLEGAGRYDREAALDICDGARGGRQYNDNPSEIPVLFADAERFWPNDKPDWREQRWRREMPSEADAD